MRSVHQDPDNSVENKKHQIFPTRIIKNHAFGLSITFAPIAQPQQPFEAPCFTTPQERAAIPCYPWERAEKNDLSTPKS